MQKLKWTEDFKVVCLGKDAQGEFPAYILRKQGRWMATVVLEGDTEMVRWFDQLTDAKLWCETFA